MVEGAEGAIPRLSSIDPIAFRTNVESKSSDAVMAKGYEAVCQKLVC